MIAFHNRTMYPVRMNTPLDRRSFLAMSATTLPFLSTLTSAQDKPRPGAPSRRPVVISSANGIPAVNKAMEMIRAGSDPLDAIVAGINIVEDDPNDNSVGYGGLPNEEGVVELDSSCLHGPSHKAGAVAGLRNIKNPSSVALQVLRRTDHVLLVGEGALKFAKAMGFPEEDLLTPETREAWIKWKANLNRDDDWLDKDQQIPASNINNKQSRARKLGIPFTTGTIHCSAVDAHGDLSACTSTSGLSWKLAGRVGDSPIVGAGMFCDNAIGSGGATGRGEACIQSCAAFQVVQHMGNGLAPVEACLKVLQWIADHTRQNYLLDEKRRPNFGVILYALRKDGAYASAAFRKGPKFAVHDGNTAHHEECAALYPD
jgi:N4-(beta-N-acetylglucosaminyl)-L-asparaginase